MRHSAIFTAAVLATTLFTSQARAAMTVQVEEDRLRINSGYSGPETIRVFINQNTGFINISNNRSPQVHEVRANISIMTFNGDADRDVFYNETSLRCYAWGGEGNDSLFGGSGVDSLQGGAGRDDLYGNDGDDFLNPGEDLEEGSVHGGYGTNTCTRVRFWAHMPTTQTVSVLQEFELFTNVAPEVVSVEVHWTAIVNDN